MSARAVAVHSQVAARDGSDAFSDLLRSPFNLKLKLELEEKREYIC